MGQVSSAREPQQRAASPIPSRSREAHMSADISTYQPACLPRCAHVAVYPAPERPLKRARRYPEGRSALAAPCRRRYQTPVHQPLTPASGHPASITGGSDRACGIRRHSGADVWRAPMHGGTGTAAACHALRYVRHASSPLAKVEVCVRALVHMLNLEERCVLVLVDLAPAMGVGDRWVNGQKPSRRFCAARSVREAARAAAGRRALCACGEGRTACSRGCEPSSRVCAVPSSLASPARAHR